MSTPSPQTFQLRSMVGSIALNAVVPLVVYTLARPYFASDVTALIIAAVIPLLVTVVGFLVRRKVDMVGAISVVGFVVAVALQLITGDGDGLIVKVQGVIITGPIGVLLLLSALIGRPLVAVIFNYIARRNPERRLPSRHQSMVITLILGTMFTLHTVVAVALALTLSTPVFLVVSNPVGWAILAVGLLSIFLVRRRWQAAREAAERSVQQA